MSTRALSPGLALLSGPADKVCLKHMQRLLKANRVQVRVDEALDPGVKADQTIVRGLAHLRNRRRIIDALACSKNGD